MKCMNQVYRYCFSLKKMILVVSNSTWNSRHTNYDDDDRNELLGTVLRDTACLILGGRVASRSEAIRHTTLPPTRAHTLLGHCRLCTHELSF